MKYWQIYAIRIACVLDDGLDIRFRYSKSETSSKLVLNTLVNARFVRNKEESVWEPTKILTWLEVSVHLNKGCIYVSKELISNLLETVDYISDNPKISARTLAKLAGKIITTKYVLGDITTATWEKKFNINNYKKTNKQANKKKWLMKFYSGNLT